MTHQEAHTSVYLKTRGGKGGSSPTSSKKVAGELKWQLPRKFLGLKATIPRRQRRQNVGKENSNHRYGNLVSRTPGYVHTLATCTQI